MEKCDFEPKTNFYGVELHQCICGAFVANCKKCHRDKHMNPEDSKKCPLHK